MDVTLPGSQQINEGHGKLPREDWLEGLKWAILEIGKMAQRPNFTEQLEHFEPKFKEIVRDSIKELWRLRFRVQNELLPGRRDQWKEQIRKDAEVLCEVLEENIFVDGVYDNLPPRLQSLMDALWERLSHFEEYGRYGWMLPVYFHPYLSDASTRIEFMKGAYDFFYKEQPRSRKGFEWIFQENLGTGWKSTVKGITRKVLEYEPRQDWDGQETYKCAIDRIRLWRHAHAHYKDHLPEGERELSEIEIEDRISQDFPGYYEKIYLSVIDLLTSKKVKNKKLQEKLLDKLASCAIGLKVGGNHGQSRVQTGSTAGGQSQLVTSVRPRESTTASSRSAAGGKKYGD